MSDYPDWQTFPNAIGSNLFPGASVNLATGAYPGAVLPASSYSSLSVTVVPASGAGTIVIQHWSDAAGTMSAQTDTFRFRQGAALVVRVPLRATYVQLTLNVTSGANLVASTWAALLNSSSERVTFPVAGQQAGAGPARVLPASAQDQWRVPAICAGNGMLAFAPADATGKLQVYVQAADELGAQLYYIMPPAQPVALLMQPLALPGQVTEIVVTNTDAGAPHTYAVSLICPP